MGYLILLAAGLLVAKKAAENNLQKEQTPQQLVEANISRSVPTSNLYGLRLFENDAAPISPIGRGSALDANSNIIILPAPGFTTLPKNVTPVPVAASSSGAGAAGGAGGASGGFGPPVPPGGFHFFG